MRFRTDVRDVHALLDPVSCFVHAGHTCLVVLGPDVTRLVMAAEHTSGEQIYADIPTLSWCENLKIESMHHNQIPFLVHLPNLLKILKGLDRADRSTLRLAKLSGRPYLSVETQLGDQTLTQHLPIALQSIKRLAEFEEPVFGEPLIKFKLPAFKMLATLMDKMKYASDLLSIQANTEGTLRLGVEHMQLHISSEFKGLRYQPPTSSSTPQPGVASASPLGDGYAGSASPATAQALVAQTLEREAMNQHQQQEQQQNGGAGDTMHDNGGGAAAPVAPVPQDGFGPEVPASAFSSAIDGSPSSQLHTPSQGSHRSGSQLPGESYSCKVSIKKFANVCNAKNMAVHHALGCFVEDTAFVVYLKLKHRRGAITYYLPIINE